MVPGPSRSQIACSTAGSSVAAKPFGEPDPGSLGLALGPLVPVEPDLGGAREVGGDLDERRTEMPMSAFRALCRTPGYAEC
jgi:hypothetical protein